MNAKNRIVRDFRPTYSYMGLTKFTLFETVYVILLTSVDQGILGRA